MSSKERLASELSKLVDATSSVRGVVGVILFGSYARGDFDKYSDYDLLVIFEDEGSMWKGWDELFMKVGALRLLVHVIPKTLDEFWKSEPTFLAEVLSHGKVLFAKYPLEIPAALAGARRMAVIAYSMEGLDRKAKARLVYRLYGRKSSGVKGLVDEVGGVKLSEGCVLVPEEAARRVEEVVRGCGASVKVIRVLVEAPPRIGVSGSGDLNRQSVTSELGAA